MTGSGGVARNPRAPHRRRSDKRRPRRSGSSAARRESAALTRSHEVALQARRGGWRATFCQRHSPVRFPTTGHMSRVRFTSAVCAFTAKWKRSRSVRRSRGGVGYISPFRYLARSTLIGIRYTLALRFRIALIADLAKARFQSSVGLKPEGNMTLFVVSQ